MVLNKLTIPRAQFSRKNSVTFKMTTVTYIHIKISRKFFPLILKQFITDISYATFQKDLTGIGTLQV